MSSDASIVLLTYNGEKYLREVLDMIEHQQIKPLEVIAIDSGSTDRTIEILREHNVTICEIPNSEFSHSATRNKAISLARGSYIVYLTQDATPADSCWLDSLLRPFELGPNVAGTFSRQIPRAASDPLEASDLAIYFGLERRIHTRPSASHYKKDIWNSMKFSNASAAYRRNVLEQNPFDESLKMAEDQEWAKRILEKGYETVYEPESRVLHSHNHSLAQKYQRDYSMGTAFSQFLSPLLGPRRIPVAAWLAHIFFDVRALVLCNRTLREKISWLLKSPVHRAAQHLAYWKGWNRIQGIIHHGGHEGRGATRI